MLSSPFQQPSPRQNALALQIQEARTSGDQALLAGLISQWVHRYGFTRASELDLSWPEPAASNREFSPEGVAEEPSRAPETVVEDKTVVEEDALVAEEVGAQAADLQRSFNADPVPAPPISTPRSLRRWLPRREDDAFPKAS